MSSTSVSANRVDAAVAGFVDLIRPILTCWPDCRHCRTR